MIAYIKGKLAAFEEDKVIVDVGGVGYGIFMPAQAMGRLPSAGNEIKLYTYLNVKEDAMQLFGFLTRDDLHVFKLLIGVSGIGPKGGQSILSVLSPDDLRFAVMAGDVKAISAAPGIGRKTAEKLIVELRDKLSIEDALEHSLTEGNQETGRQADPCSGIIGEAVEALTALGYGSTEALKAVKQVAVAEDMDAGAVLKQALKFML